MNSFLQAFLLWVFLCTGSLSGQSTVFLAVKVGSSAVLPCDWRNITTTQSATQNPHVEWRTISETVFERRGVELYQAKGYEDRVDVPEDHLLKGNCSLVMKDVRLSDAGPYASFLLVRRAKRSLRSKRVFLQSVELSVDDKPEEIHIENKAAEQITEESSSLGQAVIPASQNAATIHISTGIVMFILLPSIFFHFI